MGRKDNLLDSKREGKIMKMPKKVPTECAKCKKKGSTKSFPLHLEMIKYIYPGIYDYEVKGYLCEKCGIETKKLLEKWFGGDEK